MSTIKVGKISANLQVGSDIVCGEGITVSSGVTTSNVSLTSSGVATCGTLSGSASGMTNLPVLQEPKTAGILLTGLGN